MPTLLKYTLGDLISDAAWSVGTWGVNYAMSGQNEAAKNAKRSGAGTNSDQYGPPAPSNNSGGKIIVNGKTYDDPKAVKEFVAIVAGESSNNTNEAQGIGEVILRRLEVKGAKLEGDFVSKIGGSEQFDAIGGKIYSKIMDMSWDEINNESNPYRLRISGAAKALGGYSNVSKGAYFWNASTPQLGFNWKQVGNGTFLKTAVHGQTTF